MKKTISALTAAAALSGTVFGFGTAIPAKASAQANPPAEETTSSSAELVKIFITPLLQVKCRSRYKVLRLTKAQKGMSMPRWENRKDRLEETICLIYTAGIWEIPATAFPITKT